MWFKKYRLKEQHLLIVHNKRSNPHFNRNSTWIFSWSESGQRRLSKMHFRSQSRRRRQYFKRGCLVYTSTAHRRRGMRGAGIRTISTFCTIAVLRRQFTQVLLNLIWFCKTFTGGWISKRFLLRLKSPPKRTIRLKRRWKGEWFHTFFWIFEPKRKTFQD